MTLKDLKLILRASPDSLVKDIDKASAPVGLVEDILKAIVAFARNTGADLDESEIGFFDGSLGIEYRPNKSGQNYTLPETILLDKEYQGGFHVDDPYYQLIKKFEKASKKYQVDIDVKGVGRDLHITPTHPAKLRLLEPLWIKTELNLQGEIIEIGGKTPNIHLLTYDGLQYIIDITKEQARDLRIYRQYELIVHAEERSSDGALRSAVLKEYELIPERSEMSAEELIALEGPAWSNVTNAVEWVRRNFRDDDE